MKFNSQRQIVKYDGVLEENEFQIKMGPKIFSILSGAIYSDVVLAIVRELSQNARDSHKEAKNDKTPFEVTLPTTWNCQFIIRDYGVGLSPDRIKQVFLTYGESTKDSSNDYIGMLGIGAKVPFAYHTKSFTLESWFDGTHTIYSAHIGEDLLPKLVKMSETPSTEKPGVKIVIPVIQTDIYNFQEAAKKVYTWFEPKPKINGTVLNIPKIESILKGDSEWELRKADYNIYSGAMAVMGSMAYPISFQDTSLSPELTALLTTPVTLFFKLGDVDIAASRESLSYDVKTKSNIITRFKQIVDELNSRVEKEVANCKTLFEARQKVGQVLQKLPSPTLKNCINLNQVKFNGGELFPKNAVNLYDLSVSIPTNFNITSLEKSYGGTVRTGNRHIVSYLHNFTIIEADLKLGNIGRAKEYYINNNVTCPFMYLVTFANPKEKDDLVKFLGCDDKDIILASTLPAPTPVARGPNAVPRNKTTKIMEYNGGAGSCSYCWSTAQKDLKKDTGVWVELNTFKFRTPWAKTIHQEPKKLAYIIEYLNILGKLNNSNYKGVKEVYGLKSAYIGQIDNTLWTNLFDLVKKEVNAIVKDNDFLTAMALGNGLEIGGYHSQYRRYLPDFKTLQTISTKLNKPKHKFYETINTISKYKGFHAKYENAIKAFEFLKGWVEKQPVVKTVQVDKPSSMINDLYQKYNLLPYIDYSTSVPQSAIVEYLELVN